MAEEGNNYGVIQETISHSDPVRSISESLMQQAQGAEPESVEPEAEAVAPVAPEVEAAPKEDDQFAAKFAALGRKEKALQAKIQQREDALAAKEAEIEAKLAEIEERGGKYDNLSQRLKTNPMEVLQENDLSFEDLSTMFLDNDGKPTTDMQLKMLKDEIDNKYGKEIEELNKKLQEKEEQEKTSKQQAAIDDFKFQISDHVEENVEKFELIKAQNAIDTVYEVIEQHYSEYEKILPVEEACEHVENYLFDNAKKWLEYNKIKNLVKPAPGEEQEGEQRQTSVTLSNTEAAQVPTSGERKLSKEERFQNAAALIKWDD